MASADKTGLSIEKIILKASQKLSNGIESSQRNAYTKILGLVKGLEVNSSEDIKRTKANIKLIRKINTEINKAVITDVYLNRVDAYLSAFDDIDIEQTGYFSLAFNKFRKRDIYSLIKKESINNARSLLMHAGISKNLSDPIKSILDRNVLSGASYNDMLNEVRGFMLGSNKVEGRLLSYVKQVTSDSLHVYSGVYNQSVAEDLGLSWLKYTGSIKDTTRDFCSSRAGKYFHKSEVEKWASLSWKGKMKGTTSSSIYYYVGGYHCRHLLIYVSEEVVPKKKLAKYS